MTTRRGVLAGGAALGITALALPRAAAHASVLVPAADSGDGTESSPYLIGTAADLDWMSALYATGPVAGLHFRLARDINIPADVTPFTPIPSFTGVLDGGGFSISGLTVSLGATARGGLFRSLTGSAVVRDLTLVGASVTGSHEMGALAGFCDSAGVQVTDVHVRVGTVTSTRTGANAADTGGLVGYATAGTFTGCSSTARVVATGRNVGGLVGDARGTLIRCWASGAVGPADGGTAADAAYGGLVGLSSATITDCYARGAVTGANSGSRDGLGGLIGSRVSGTVTRAYATGAVARAGTVTSAATLGGLTAVSSSGTTTASFWDTQTTGQASSADGTGATGHTTAQMKDAATFTDAGWDLTAGTGTWAIDPTVNGGYPSLRTNPPA